MKKITLAFLLLTTPAFAQTPPQPSVETLQAIISALQIQRNSAEDQAAAFGAQSQILQKEITAAQKRISDLESKASQQTGPTRDVTPPK